MFRWICPTNDHSPTMSTFREISSTSYYGVSSYYRMRFHLPMRNMLFWRYYSSMLYPSGKNPVISNQGRSSKVHGDITNVGLVWPFILYHWSILMEKPMTSQHHQNVTFDDFKEVFLAKEWSSLSISWRRSRLRPSQGFSRRWMCIVLEAIVDITPRQDHCCLLHLES